MTTTDSMQTYHAQTRRFFEKIAQEKARATGFVKNDSPLNGSLFLLSLVLTVFAKGTLALPDLGVMARRLRARLKARLQPQRQITGQAFKERYTKVAVTWLQAMLVEALRFSLPHAGAEVVPLLQGFTAVKLLDATVIPLPETLQAEFPGCGGGGAQAALKLYLVLDWLTGQYTTLQIKPGRKADQNMGEPFLADNQPGTLWLFDLGFFKVAFLAALAAAKSYFLCRLQAQVQLWSENAAGVGEKLDLDELLRRAPRETFEIAVRVGPPKAAVAARLVAVPVPREVANERRRKAHKKAKKSGRTPTQKTLARLDWTLLLTNAPAEQLPTTTVLTVYGVRWQVELAFKLAKSDLQLDQTQATEPQRVQCEFYAKLIALLLFNRLAGVAEDLLGEKISPVQLFRRMRGDLDQWLRVLGRGRAATARDWLQLLGDYSQPSLRQAQSTLLRVQALSETVAQQRQLLDPLGWLREKYANAAAGHAAFRQRLVLENVCWQAKPAVFQRATATALP